MNLGVMIPAYCTGDHLVDPAVIKSWPTRAEDAGFESLWVGDHIVKSHVYKTSLLDPVSTLGYAAAVTDDIDLVTSILLLPQRHTAQVAHAFLALQHLAGDRTIHMGLGAGYVPKEFEAIGIPMSERGHRLTEGLVALKRLFEGEASFDGKFHSFEDVRIDPTKANPPKLVAGGDSVFDDSGERQMPTPVLNRILRTGAWIAAPDSPENVAEEWSIIREYAEDNDVDPESIDRYLLNYVHLVEGDDKEEVYAEQEEVFNMYYEPERGLDYTYEHCLLGTTDEILDQLKEYEELGMDHVAMGPPGAAAHTNESLLNQLEIMTEEFLPHFS